MKTFLIAILFLSTYSCAAHDQFIDDLREKNRARGIMRAEQTCSQMGYTPNTNAFRDCVALTYNSR